MSIQNVIHEDVTGKEISIGDYVSYALTGRSYIVLGQVVGIANKTIRVKNILSDDRVSVYPSNIAILEGADVIDRIEKKILMYQLRK